MIYAVFIVLVFCIIVLMLFASGPRGPVIIATGAKKKPKSAVGYENPARGEDHCKLCTYFERIEPNHCSKVQGIIVPQAWCRLFEEK